MKLQKGKMKPEKVDMKEEMNSGNGVNNHWNEKQNKTTSIVRVNSTLSAVKGWVNWKLVRRNATWRTRKHEGTEDIEAPGYT